MGSVGCRLDSRQERSDGVAYRLVIFDFDGTLADSAGWVRGVLNDVARRYGFRTLMPDEFTMLRGQDSRAVIRYLGVPMWKMPVIAAHMRRLMRRDAGSIALFGGVDALLRTLAEQGVTLAIVSSNAEDNVRRILGPENAALIAHYECGASLFGKRSRFRRVLRRAGIPAAETIAIGDETRDIEAAALEGLASGAVEWGYATPDLLRRHNPTLMFDSVERMAAVLTGG